nr:KilA-N domain-containing protein [Aquabacterium sp. NJ1]
MTFRADGWFNMTAAAQAFGRRLDNFWILPTTAEYLGALRESLKISELSTTKRGHHGGTWAHPKLAVFFARWLDVKFSVWCDMVIEELVRGATPSSDAFKGPSALGHSQPGFAAKH